MGDVLGGLMAVYLVGNENNEDLLRCKGLVITTDDVAMALRKETSKCRAVSSNLGTTREAVMFKVLVNNFYAYYTLT